MPAISGWSVCKKAFLYIGKLWTFWEVQDLHIVTCLIIYQHWQPLCLQAASWSSSILQVLFFPLPIAPPLKEAYGPLAAKQLLHRLPLSVFCSPLDRQPNESAFLRGDEPENVISGTNRAKKKTKKRNAHLSDHERISSHFGREHPVAALFLA